MLNTGVAGPVGETEWNPARRHPSRACRTVRLDHTRYGWEMDDGLAVPAMGDERPPAGRERRPRPMQRSSEALPCPQSSKGVSEAIRK